MELAEHGTPEVLDRIEQALLDAGAHRVEGWSKLGRVLAERVTTAAAAALAGKDACGSWGRPHPAEGGNGFGFGWLMRDEQARAERVEAQLDSAWATLRRRARALTG